eukprot:JP443662.1.p1 GENE.JP443662.1~~JP443662.1.p1  ORF type:complete len:64 (+),score=1.02 JP443662.1:14-205(+)
MSEPTVFEEECMKESAFQTLQSSSTLMFGSMMSNQSVARFRFHCVNTVTGNFDAVPAASSPTA